MANHNLPTLSSTYADFVSHLDARLDDILVGVDVTSTGLPNGTIRWEGTTWKKYVLSSNSWTDLASSYSININGTVGATTPTTGAFTTLSTTGVASLGANSTVGTVPIVSTTGTQTLTNKTLTSPVISSISNSGTVTLPTTTTTLVGRDTTDTLSNKTLTRPRFADGGSIDDADGNKLIEFDSVASAINYLKVANAPTGSPAVVTLTAAGGNTDISLNLVPTGSGSITINGVPAVTTTGTQTLTNKTLGTGTVYNGGTIGHDYGGTGTTTAPVAGAVVYGASTAAQGYTAAGTSGQLLQSGGAASPSWVSPSTLSVSYAASAGSVTNGVYTTGNQTIDGVKTFGKSVFLQLPSEANSEVQLGFTHLSGNGTVYFYHQNNTDRLLGIYDSHESKTRWYTDKLGNLYVTKYITAATHTGAYTSQAGTTDQSKAGFYTTISQSGSSYSPAIKIKSTGSAVTRVHSFGSLHNSDATISTVIHSINDDNSTNNRAWEFRQNGDFLSPGNVTAYSDERIKFDWKPVSADYVKNLAELKSGTYSRTDIPSRQAGVGAQSLQKILPEAVVADAKGMLSVNYGAAAMVSAVELAKLVLQLQREIEELKQKLA